MVLRKKFKPAIDKALSILTTPKPLSNRVSESETYCNALLALPSEILIEICRLLPHESVATLSLTCKPLHIWFNQCRKHLYGDTRRRLLHLLEVDLPSLVTCSSCLRLYDWRAAECVKLDHSCPGRSFTSHSGLVALWPRSAQDRAPWKELLYEHIRHSLSSCTLVCFCPSFHENFGLTIELRDLVLRAKAYGPSFGLPLSLLDHEHIDRCLIDTSQEDGSDKASRSCGSTSLMHIDYSIEVKARICEGKLFLKHMYTFTVDTALNARVDIVDQLHAMCTGKCIHPCLDGALLSITAQTLCAALEQHLPPMTKVRHASTALLHCRHCAMDVRVEASSSDHRKGKFCIRVVTYYDCGSRDIASDSAQTTLFRTGMQDYHDHIDEALCRNLESKWPNASEQDPGIQSHHFEAPVLQNQRQSWETATYPGLIQNKRSTMIQSWNSIDPAGLRNIYGYRLKSKLK